MSTRTFTPKQLEEWDVRSSSVYAHEEFMEEHRWYNLYAVVFKAPDTGKFYRVHHEVAKSDGGIGSDPWGDQGDVEGTEVEQRVTLALEWTDTGKAIDPARNTLTASVSKVFHELKFNVSAQGRTWFMDQLMQALTDRLHGKDS